MSSQMDFLRDLLRSEHVLLARSVARAQTEAELREAADASLSFASTLLAERDSPRNTHNFLGVPFWYFARLDTFLRGWPAIAGTELGLAAPPQAGEGAPEAQVQRLSEQAADHGLVVLWKKSRAQNGTPEGPFLVVDRSLASAEQFLTFLFGIALRRLPDRRDLEALRPEIMRHAEGSKEQFAHLCTIILGSLEAQRHGTLWERV